MNTEIQINTSSYLGLLPWRGGESTSSHQLEDRACASRAVLVNLVVLVGLLGLVLLTWLKPSPAMALNPDNRFRIAVLQYRGLDEPVRVEAGRRLVWELLKRTSVFAEMEPVMVSASSRKQLFQAPFLVLMGQKELPKFTQTEVANLRLYLQMGGFLFVDSLGHGPGSPFDRSLRTLVEQQIMPGKRFVPLTPEHVLFKSFYLLDRPYGRVMGAASMEGLEVDGGRLAVVYSHNDMPGAWARDSLGMWTHEMIPGGEPQRELAFRMGVNVVMYALCLDYKQDQVHLPFLLKKRRWRTRIGEE